MSRPCSLLFCILTILTTLLACARSVIGQCGDWDNPFGVIPFSSSVNLATCLWDPDGPGPATRQLIIGGNSTENGGVTVNRVSRWNGEAWVGFGPGLSGSVTMSVAALTSWDPDAEGPLSAQLIAGGNFTNSNGRTINRIARWDGSAWQSLGFGLSANVRALTTWDPDAAGPLPPLLIAAGEFMHSGSTVVNRIARWNGSTWQPFGTGANGTVFALATWDSDADPATPSQLIAAGMFTSAGGNAVNSIATWDGSSWLPLSTGTNGAVHALTVWDQDAAGPGLPRLIAGGAFTVAGGVTLNRIASWNGSVWQSFSSGITGLDAAVYGLTTWDPDGVGPLTTRVVAGGMFGSAGGMNAFNAAAWDGSAWHTFGPRAPVAALTTWDPDDADILPPQIVACGLVVSRWDGARWRTFGTEDSTRLVTSWDRDGDGPETPQLAAAGFFVDPNGVSVNSVALWTGDDWAPITPSLGYAFALTQWDSDGPGPLPPWLAVGGDFTTADGLTVNRVALWDGSAWHALGAGVNNPVSALTTWDPDADGPLFPQLIVGGSFVTAGGLTVNHVARWDGTSWHALGQGFNGSVGSLSTWDPDGPGALPPRLVAGGFFPESQFNSISYWEAPFWRPFASGVDGSVTSMTSWDPDDAGPLTPRLVIGGRFSTPQGASNVASWNGQAWFPMGFGMNDTVGTLTTWDPDGPGPLYSQPVAGGSFSNAGSGARYLARWDGVDWRPVGAGLINRRVTSAIIWDLDGAAPGVPQLVVAGDFDVIDNMGAARIAIWNTLPPVISSQPTDLTVTAGELARLHVSTLVANDPSLRWRKNGADITDGPTSAGSTISGAATRTLIITNAQAADSGAYDLVLTNQCGQTTSTPAQLAVDEPCRADFNRDLRVDSADFAAFLSAFFGLSLAADVNNNGRVDSQDFFDFVAAFFFGC